MRTAAIMFMLAVGLALGQAPTGDVPQIPPPAPPARAPEAPRPSVDKAKPAGGLVSLNELEDYTVKTDKLIVNNLTLREDNCVPGQGLTALRVSACYRARGTESQMYCVMLVGLDGDKNVVWAGNLKGATDPTSGVGLMQDVMLVPQGSMKMTVNLQVRVYAGEGGPRCAPTPVNAPACYPAPAYGYCPAPSLSRY